MIDGAQCSSIGEVLQARAQDQPDRLAFRELRNDLSERDQVTYAELDRRARQLGRELAERLRQGERALLLIPNSLDYLTALFGCFYSRVVAVSGVPPYAPSTRSLRHTARLHRLRTVIETSGTSAILGPGELLARVKDALATDMPSLAYIATDRVADAFSKTKWRPEAGDPEAIAMLQFTSGSTTSPGGVVLRHRNLSSNLAAQKQALQMTGEDIGVSWLPLFHDLGLIGGCLLPIEAGFPCILMPAAGFAEQPQRWLQCLSAEKGTISWAPNFAYKLCLKAVAPAERAQFDLSRWRIAMNAAEPVQAETVRRFIEGFSAAGFRPGAMYPAYGLAEATLVVSAPAPGQDLHIVRLDKAALAYDRIERSSDGDAGAVELVGCGHPAPGVEVAIVDPQTLERSPPDKVGEIWVSGASRSEGYFSASGDRAAANDARLSEGPTVWLRTGDLGFIDGGDVFVTGRLKDLIILRGANIYPHDLEATAAASHSALRDDCACAIPMSTDGEEALAIVCEIDRRREDAGPQAAAAIRRAIFKHHGLETGAIVLIRVGALPKTPSGKIQRRLCSLALQANELPVVFKDRLEPSLPNERAPPTSSTPCSPEEVQTWVVRRLARLAPNITIGLGTVLADLGLSSIQITDLAGEIEEAFGHRIPAADLFEIELVSDIVDRLNERAE